MQTLSRGSWTAPVASGRGTVSHRSASTILISRRFVRSASTCRSNSRRHIRGIIAARRARSRCGSLREISALAQVRRRQSDANAAVARELAETLAWRSRRPDILCHVSQPALRPNSYDIYWMMLRANGIYGVRAGRPSRTPCLVDVADAGRQNGGWCFGARRARETNGSGRFVFGPCCQPTSGARRLLGAANNDLQFTISSQPTRSQPEC